MQPLNELMEFDHVIQVHADGTVTEPDNIYAPELHDGEVDTGWTLLGGYSGQDRYSGPIMHSSEFIGGTMERDILATPGIYVALVDYSSSYECGECERIIHETGDPNTSWVHDETGNAFCDVTGPADAVSLTLDSERPTAYPADNVEGWAVARKVDTA